MWSIAIATPHNGVDIHLIAVDILLSAVHIPRREVDTLLPNGMATIPNGLGIPSRRGMREMNDTKNMRDTRDLGIQGIRLTEATPALCRLLDCDHLDWQPVVLMFL